jgi:hypothetical protein
MKYLSYTTATPASLLQRTVAIAATTVVGGLVLMFSAILFVIILSFSAVAWTYLMWKSRELRKQMRNFPPNDQRPIQCA